MMRLTVLTDNNTYIDQYYLGEPALCIHIEDGDERILFDTGYSDAFLCNAETMGIDLSKLTAIVLSHGHNDHTGGLPFLWKKYDLSGVKLIAHPDVFLNRRYEGLEIGAPYTRKDCEDHGLQVIDGSTPVKLSEKLLFLGSIPRVTAFEGRVPIGEYRKEKVWKPDYLADDSALVYQGEEGPWIITGCSHSGICNIISCALEITGASSVKGVLGGFHLMEKNDILKQTIGFLKTHTEGTLYPCHCVCLEAKCEMMKELPVQEVGVGLQLEVI
ncbi:MAG: MBL fold metallo-hydrolase [Solobacterium sp.]|nr:MBL fold metallo-hydrolase [Solobacterium sp.]